MSPSLNQGLGIAYVEKKYNIGQVLELKIRNENKKIKLAKLPFIEKQYKK